MTNAMKPKSPIIELLCGVSLVLSSCASEPSRIAGSMDYKCLIPSSLPRTIDLQLKSGELRIVDAYKMYLDHHFAGWKECLDRFMLGPDYLDVKNDSPLAFGASEMIINARRDGFNSALQQIQYLVNTYGYDDAKAVVSRYVYSP